MGTATEHGHKGPRLQQAWDEAIAACRDLDRGTEGGADSICQRYQATFVGMVMVLHQLYQRPNIEWLRRAESLIRPVSLDTFGPTALLVVRAASLSPIPPSFTESDWGHWHNMVERHRAEDHEEAERLARLLAGRHGGTQSTWLDRARQFIAADLPKGINI